MQVCIHINTHFFGSKFQHCSEWRVLRNTQPGEFTKVSRTSLHGIGNLHFIWQFRIGCKGYLERYFGRHGKHRSGRDS